MYVKIGPYPRTVNFRIFSSHMNRMYDGKWPTKRNYTKVDRFMNWLDDAVTPVERLLNVFARTDQKKKIVIHGYDTWSAYTTLGEIILPVLRKMANDKHGTPFTDDEDVPEHLRSTNAPPTDAWEMDDLADDRWQWIIGEMIFAFERTIDEEWERDFYSGKSSINWVPVDKEGNVVDDLDAEYYQMEEDENNTFEVDREGLKAVHERISNGLILFGKYYRTLWT